MSSSEKARWVAAVIAESLQMPVGLLGDPARSIPITVIGLIFDSSLFVCCQISPDRPICPHNITLNTAIRKPTYQIWGELWESPTFALLHNAFSETEMANNSALCTIDFRNNEAPAAYDSRNCNPRIVLK
jgi:hypothetical protein